MQNIISISNEHSLQYWRYFIFIVMCLCVMACGDNAEKDAALKVTENFVIAYYVDDDVKESLSYTIGQAKKKLETELESIKKYAGNGNVEQKPYVTYKLLKTKKVEDSIYNWQVTDQYDQKINVAIKVVDSDQGWHIVDFEEKEKE